MSASPRELLRLRRHIVRCSPTQHELADRTPLVLTTRDHQLLAAVYSHGLLDMQAIELAFFPPGPDGRSSCCSAAYDRVRQLWLWGFVDRIELPVAPRLGGLRPYLYALGWRGVSAVAASNGNGTRVVQRRRLDRMDDLFVDHDLKAALFWANLTDLLRDSRVTDWTWTSERDIRAEKRRVYDPESQKTLRVLPDAEFKIRYPSGRRQLGLVEIDMGTLTLNRFRQKMRAFDLYARAMANGSGEDADAAFHVFVVTHSQARKEQLRQATYREIEHGRSADFFFDTFDVLDPEEFDEGNWVHTNGKRYYLAYREAFCDVPQADADVQDGEDDGEQGGDIDEPEDDGEGAGDTDEDDNGPQTGDR